MAILNKEFTKFDTEIKLNKNKKDDLIKSKEAIKDKIKKYFKEEKENEIQPKFWGQGSFSMNTTINPIPIKDEKGNNLYKYDLDYGVYFIKKEDSDIKRSINTWHDWVYNAVENHTNQLPDRKTTCIRVVFSDGHHIDLPIYYKDGDVPELAHKSKGWIESDPKEFYEWFNKEAKSNQIKKIVRVLKAWKNFKETNNSSLKLPSGFALSILIVNNYEDNDNLDIAFRETIRKIKSSLDDRFECLRPTTPENEDIFENYSPTKKNNFLSALDSLIKACDLANDEDNFKNASEHLRKHLGDRFPLGKDESEKEKNNSLEKSLGSAIIPPKPYANGWE